MLPKWHGFLAILFTFIIHYIYQYIYMFYISVVFIAAVFIDVDHYLYYIYKTKNLNVRKAFYYFYNGKGIKEERKPYFAVFHNIEFLLIFGIFSLTHLFLFSIFIGFMFHMLLDWGYNIYYKAFSLKWYSILLYGYEVAKRKNN